MADVGDLVVQAKHWPDGYVFRVLEDRGATVLAQPLDSGTLEPATAPTLVPVHIAYNGTPVYDGSGQPITTLEPVGPPAAVGPVELNAATIAPYPEV